MSVRPYVTVLQRLCSQSRLAAVYGQSTPHARGPRLTFGRLDNGLKQQCPNTNTFVVHRSILATLVRQWRIKHAALFPRIDERSDDERRELWMTLQGYDPRFLQ